MPLAVSVRQPAADNPPVVELYNSWRYRHPPQSLEYLPGLVQTFLRCRAYLLRRNWSKSRLFAGCRGMRPDHRLSMRRAEFHRQPRQSDRPHRESRRSRRRYRVCDIVLNQPGHPRLCQRAGLVERECLSLPNHGRACQCHCRCARQSSLLAATRSCLCRSMTTASPSTSHRHNRGDDCWLPASFHQSCECRRKPQCDGPQRRGLWQQCDQRANPRHFPRAGPPRHAPIAHRRTTACLLHLTRLRNGSPTGLERSVRRQPAVEEPARERHLHSPPANWRPPIHRHQHRCSALAEAVSSQIRLQAAY